MATQSLVKAETELAPAATPMALLQIAMNQNADIDKLTRLMELQERWEANLARDEFNESFAAFKANPPQISKNKHVRFQTSKGVTEYDHATLDNVVNTITAALSKHGISHRWGVEQSAASIRVTCTLSKGRHSESASLAAGPDESGGKNTIQAIASTVSYLERYTLLAVAGMATGDMDNDGACAASLPDLSERLEFMGNCSTMTELQTQFNVHYTAAKAAKDQRAMSAIIAAKDARKKELAA